VKPVSGARRALLGAVWLSTTGYTSFVLNFGVTLLLVRFLFPKDFGQFALASSLVDLLSIITAFSFSQGIIQMQDAPEVAETAYVLSRRLYWGMLVGGGLLCLALSRHYPGVFIPLFFSLFAVRNLTLFSYVYSAQLEKVFSYNQLSMVRLVTSVASIITALALAHGGAGVWSLLGREVVLSAGALIGNRVVSRWRYRGGYNHETARRLWQFGWQMFVTRGLETLWYRADTALLGVLSGTVVLGFYDRARYLAEFGHYIVSFGAVQVAYPVYARLQGRADAVAYAYRLTHGLLVRLMFPVLVWLALFPRELVGLLYGAGQRWNETATILPWLAIFGFVYPVAENVKVLLTGIGRVDQAVRFRVVQLAVSLPLLVPAIRLWGPTGAAAVMTLSEVVGLGSSYLSLKREIGSLSLHGYLRPLIAAAVAGGVIASSRALHVLPWTGRAGFAANLAASGALYVVCLLIFDRQQLQEHLAALISAFQGEALPVTSVAPADGNGQVLDAKAAPVGSDDPR